MIKLTANQNHNKEETRNNPISKQIFLVTSMLKQKTKRGKKGIELPCKWEKRVQEKKSLCALKLKDQQCLMI